MKDNTMPDDTTHVINRNGCNVCGTGLADCAIFKAYVAKKNESQDDAIVREITKDRDFMLAVNGYDDYYGGEESLIEIAKAALAIIKKHLREYLIRQTKGGCVMDKSPEAIRKRFEAWNNERDVEILNKLEEYFDASETADSYQSYSLASPEGVLEIIRPFLPQIPDGDK